MNEKFFIRSSALVYDIKSESFYDTASSDLRLISLKARHTKFWHDWLSTQSSKDRFSKLY